MFRKSSRLLKKHITCIQDCLKENVLGNFNIIDINEMGKIKNNENHKYFYIVPINSKAYFSVDKNNMHWITLKYNDYSCLCLLNSMQPSKFMRLENCCEKYDKVEKKYTATHTRCKCKLFNSHKWAKKEKGLCRAYEHIEDCREKEIIKKRFCMLKNNKCKFSFLCSLFNIIEIEYDEVK